MLHLMLLGLLLPAGADTGPEIADMHGTYGHLGAVRPKGQGMLPGDVAAFTFSIKNLTFDKNGKAAYSVAIEVRDAKGKLLYEQKPFNSVAQSLFGGTSLPCSAQIAVPLDAEAGPVSWKVTVRDRTTDKSAETKGEGNILAPKFGIIRVGTFADPEAKVSAAPLGVVGSTLYLDFAAAHFARDAMKKPDVKVEMRILDDKGQPTTAEPMAGRVHDDIPDDARMVPMQFALTLTRPGDFTVELTANCVLCGTEDKIRATDPRHCRCNDESSFHRRVTEVSRAAVPWRVLTKKAREEGKAPTAARVQESHPTSFLQHLQAARQCSVFSVTLW